jgi:lipopolysaccharide/colanic/teichoic acid biosynthesis glycosyltransferase
MTVRDALQLTALALAMTVTASFRHYPFSAEPQLIVKRAFDIIVSAAMLALLSPLLLLASLAVRLESSGPIFSLCRKSCYNNQIVNVLNFRCRDTFICCSLKRTGLDRLPMLINVLRGDMSIVGPRCHINRPSILLYDQLSPVLRNSPLRPGLFNFEDANGRVDTEVRSFQADLFYISNWSLLLDAKILFRNFSSKVSYIQNQMHH